jgi:hypothetical protein
VIELLIVISILAVVIGAVGACLVSGLRVWECAADFNGVESEALMGLDMMEKDVMNSFVFHGVAFDGQVAGVAFAGLIDEAVGVGATERDSGAVCMRIGTVRYFYSEKDKRVVRKKWVYPNGEPEETESVAENVDGLEFSYFCAPSDGDDSGRWTDAWESETNLPDGLRMEMVFEDEGGERRFGRLVMLPGRHGGNR